MGKYHKKKQISTFHLTIEQFRYLAELLNCGYPIVEAIQFLNIDTTWIHEQLREGKELRDILLEHQKGRFYDHLAFFLTIVSLSESITCALALKEFEQGIVKKLLKKSMYPLFILLFAYLMVLFFSTMIIPQMLSMFESDGDFSMLILGVELLQIVCTILATILCIVVVIIILIFTHKSICLRIYEKRTIQIPFVSDYESYIFAGYLSQLEKRGISTRHAMEYLKEIRKDSILSIIIKNCSRELENGIDFLDVIEHQQLLNKGFKQSIKIGILTNTTETILGTFMKQQELMWEKQIKKIGIILQCVSYAMVAVLVVLVYQIMLVPLSMLENM